MKNMAVLALLQTSAFKLASPEPKSNQAKLSIFIQLSDADDTVWQRSAHDNSIDEFTTMLNAKTADVSSAPIFSQDEERPKEEVRKPVIGHFREGQDQAMAAQDAQKVNEQEANMNEIERSTLAAHAGEDRKDPLVLMAIAQATRSNDHAVVNEVLESSDNDASEDANIRRVAAKIQTDEEKNQAVNDMIQKEKMEKVSNQFAEQHMVINPETADMIPEQKLSAVQVPHPKVKKPLIYEGSTVAYVNDLDDWK